MTDQHNQKLELGTDKDVATELDISRPTVWRWVKKGLIPQPVKLSPGCTRFDMKAVRQSVAGKHLSK